MQINRKVLISLFIIGILALGIGWGTHSLFVDTETSSGNTFTAGTLDLKVGGKDDPNIVTITISNMKPGDVFGYYKWVLKNAGSLSGNLSVTFIITAKNENGENEPEEAAEDEPYGKLGGRATLGHPTDGELHEFLKPGIHPDEIRAEARPYVTITARNDTEGWWIAEVSAEVDTGASCGWGPKGWSVPSILISQWAVGPPTNYGKFGLDSWDGKTFVYGTLAPGEEIAFFFKVELASDLKAWDGTRWWDINDNVIQSDSVVLNIVFRLEQVP